MSTGINIQEIKNGYLQELAMKVDDSGVSKKDGFIDETEISILITKAQENKSEYSNDDFTQLLGLFRASQNQETEGKQRVKLSLSEICKIGLNSAKNFVKGMFCNDKGEFSLGKTALTVGAVAGLVLAAPAAAALGASAAVVAGISAAVNISAGALTGYMLFNGCKNIFVGMGKYDNAKNKEEAVRAMEQAMDGVVDMSSILVLGGLMKVGGKLTKLITGKATTKPESIKSESTATQGSNNTNTINQQKISTSETTVSNEKTLKTDAKENTTQKTVKYNDGHVRESFYTKNGDLVKEIRTDVNGKKCIKEYTYDEKGFDAIKISETYESGYIYETNPIKIYEKGMLKEVTYENGMRKEVCTDGYDVVTKWFNRQNKIVKEEFSKPNANGKIKYEETPTGYKETYVDGHTVERKYNSKTQSYDEIEIHPDGTTITRPSVFRVKS